MAQLISDRRDIDFVLHEQMGVDWLLETERYSDMNRKMFDMIISEARTFGLKEILPTYAEGDRIGAQFEAGQVKAPEWFRRPHSLYVENEWLSLTEDPKYGGQGLPQIIAAAASEYLVGANFAFTAYGTLGHGSGKMVELFGTDQQKALFLKKLYTGEWGGTMVLTEPQAGSDLGALTTAAVKNDDGTYSISGNKIFITNGDQNLTENIIHPVLARIEGAPSGPKGISIFLVPKIWVHDDGSLGDPNDVVCTGIEEKMGLHGSAAYLYALNYARERKQGRDIAAGKNPAAPQTEIINHPDVRRMLMWMKAHVEGMRSFIYYVAARFDRAECSTDEAEKARCEGLIELLTPLVKGYCSDKGFEICIQAIQIYGGYGYTKEYPVEQLARDCKITSIYEGTNGIQAMDLLGRKLGMHKGATFLDFITEIKQTVALANDIPALADRAAKVSAAADELAATAVRMGQTALSPAFRTAFATAYPFLDAMGDVIMAWMLLWRATVAAPALEGILKDLNAEARFKKISKNKHAAFYDGQLKTAAYFIDSQLPITLGKLQAITGEDHTVVDMADRSFGGI